MRRCYAAASIKSGSCTIRFTIPATWARPQGASHVIGPPVARNVVGSPTNRRLGRSRCPTRIDDERIERDEIGATGHRSVAAR